MVTARRACRTSASATESPLIRRATNGLRPLLVIVALAGAARAQPGQTAPIAAPVAEPIIYVQSGIAIGGDGANGGVFAALTVEAGYRIGGNWWLRGEGLAG